MHIYQRILLAAAAAAAAVSLAMPVQGETGAQSGTVLISHGYVAILPQAEGTEARHYLSMLTMNGRPAYCIEPQVPVIFSSGTGPEYHSDPWADASEEQKMAVKRAAYYGYGNPETGSDPADYVATQLLVWEALQAEDYEANLAGFSMCSTVSLAASACAAGQEDVPERMAEIRRRAEESALVPSFAAGGTPLDLAAGEKLSLTDQSGALEHFSVDSAELPDGLHAAAAGNTLTLQADSSLYLHGAPAEMTLVVPRRQAEWGDMQSGLVIYVSGVSQRIYSDSGIEPTPSFSLRLRFPAASILLRKQDEYGHGLEGAGFQVGFDQEMKQRVLAEDGSPRTFLSDDQGMVRIDGLPPAADIYLQEVSAPASCLRDDSIFSLKTGAPGTAAEGTWTNALRPVALRIRKQDSDGKLPLNGAGFRILELPASSEEQRYQAGLDSAAQKKAEAEDIWFFPQQKEILLEREFTGYGSFELAEPNPHISIAQREEGTFLTGSGHAFALLRGTDAGGSIRTFSICISSDRPEGKITGVPVLAAETGEALLFLPGGSDAAGKTVELFQDEAGLQPAGALTADSQGILHLGDSCMDGCWIRQPGAAALMHVQAMAPEDRQGLLEAKNLRWGREYLICETGLPEGYDYGSHEACVIRRLQPAEGSDAVEETWDNSIRRLRINVHKVDQDDAHTPLNSAWFTVEDITGMQEDAAGSSFRPGLADIPADAAAGQTFFLRRALAGGARHRWKIESIDEAGVRICGHEDGMTESCYAIPPEGYSAEAPMLYQDVKRAVNPLRVGAIFEAAEKESIDSMHAYQILALQRSSGLDVFGGLAEERMICGAVLQEGDGSPFSIGRISSVQQQRMIGTYVTGSLLSEHMEEVPSVPITFEEAAAAAGGADRLQEGMHIAATLRRSARMPSADELGRLDPAVGSDFRYDGLSWRAEAHERQSWVISAGEQSYEIGPGIVTGDAGFQESAMLRISAVRRNDRGEAVACTVISPEQDSWYLEKGSVPSAVAAGKAGVRVEVYRNPSDSAPAAVGYTASDGRVLFSGLEEGTWYVRSEGETAEQQVVSGGIEIHDIPYGHSIRICEIRSPLGYVIGNACEVLTPETSYTEDTVENHRTNAKASIKVRKVLKQRRMGVE